AEHRNLIRPTLLGSWNVVSPEFVAQEEIDYYPGGRRYEPGMLNLPGIIGMAASMEMLLDVSVADIARRILGLRTDFLAAIRSLGYRLYIEECDLDPATPDSARSGIISVTHTEKDMKKLAGRLRAGQVEVSLRQNRNGECFVRFSPHFYNTQGELERVVELMQ
ncbi:MAG: aminotransferase class V-fold PLP-dependent enzyme, partial [bacterium]|nr:aminotransferase class V-fold PLP-dependent enzyme [bacterium]